MSSTASSETASADERSASSDGSGGLSEASKIGLGVGLGVGIPLLFAAVVLLCIIQRRRRGNKQMTAKYSRQAQSDLSMVEQSQSVHPKAGRALDAPLAGGLPPPGQRETADHSGEYDEVPPAHQLHRMSPMHRLARFQKKLSSLHLGAETKLSHH
ncbi:unnamed protein product [Cercospora beticola]|nr:unnamed protein product [Cercospora beticola]